MPPSSCQSLRSVPVSSHPAPGNPLGTPQQMPDGFGSQLWKRLQNRRGEAFGLQLQHHQAGTVTKCPRPPPHAPRNHSCHYEGPTCTCMQKNPKSSRAVAWTT